MSALFKELTGTRILLNKPTISSSVELTENAKKELEQELVGKFSRLKVVAVGSGVSNPLIKEGTEVYVSPSYIMNMDVVTVNGDHYLIANESQILIIW
jgi:hypothetical protein